MAATAPQSATQTALDAAFKELYPNARMQDVAMKGHAWFSEVPKDDDFEGDQIVVPLSYGNPQGRSADYQKSQTQRTASKKIKWIATQKANYGHGELDALAIRSSRSNRGAFVRVMENEMNGTLRQHGDDLALDLYRDGYGVLFQVSTTVAPSGTTITLENAEDGINVEHGMTLEFADGSDGSTPRTGGARESLEVTAVDPDNGTITVDAAVTNISGLAVGDYAFVGGDRNTGRVKILGLGAWLPLTAPTGSDSFLSVNRSVHPQRLAGHRLAGTGSLPEDILTVCERVARDKGRPDRVYVSHTQFTNLAFEMGAKQQYINQRKADIGFSGFPIHTSSGELTVIPDRDCPSNRFYVIQLDTWKLHHLDGLPHFDTLDGNRILRYEGGARPSYKFATRSWGELICDAPGWNGVGSIA